jgi:heme exporter protein B
MRSVLAAALLVARKDLAIEFRTKTAFFAASVFAAVAVAAFYFTWDPTAVPAADLAPGVLWVIFVFSALLGLNRSFGVEQADRALDALLAAPIAREAIFLGKAAANLLFVLGVQLVAFPFVALIYGVSLWAVALPLAGVAVLAAVGVVAVGTLFSAMAVNTRLAELLLPMLALRFFVPVVIAAGRSTALLLGARPPAEAFGWLRVLVAFDLVFVFACTAAFPFVVEE